MKWLRRSLYILGGLLVLVLIAAAGGYLWLRTSLPETSGRIAVPRLGAEAEIVRDGDGIVTIRAQSEADAFYALGFAHAQDRLFQMDMMRRLGAGRLSEVVGDATVNVDKTMRILGLYRVAQASLAKIPNEMRVTLEAYAAGVNAFLDTHSGALPPEFVVLGYSPERWQPADSLVWGRLMALQLSGNWSEELLRYRLAARLTPAQLNELWRAPPADELGIPQAKKPDDHAAAPALPDVLRDRGASNNFVVAGSRTASGKPLLANDPHLGLQTPIQWYLVRLETPTLTLVGATAPGVPMLIIGHNGKVAWSFVTTGTDTQDLFIEKLLPGDPTHYLGPAGPLAFETRDEVIKVAGAADVTLTVRRGRHGPILSDAPSLEWTDPAQGLALSWPGFDEDDGTAAALYRIDRARNADELVAAAKGFGSPMQNILYADTEGHIGFIAPGSMPLRKKLNANGQMPAPGWTGDYDWNGYQPVDSLPQTVDPQQGWIATGNNDIRPEDYGRFLAGRWEAPYRYNRIAELLEATPQHAAATLAAIQLDTLSSAAAETLSSLLDAVEPDASMKTSAAAKALRLLKAWDFRMARDRPEPLIFTAWMAELDKAILSDELGDLFVDYASWNLRDGARFASQMESPWCDDTRTADIETCKTEINKAWRAAIDKLAAAYGGNPADWRWGDAHQARFGHPMFDRIPVLRRLASDPIAADGDDTTVNRATPRVDFDSVVFPDVHGAGLRAIFDLADLDRSRFIIAGGQSGNPLSSHYHDLVELWRDGRYLPIRSSGNLAIQMKRADVLTLVPSAQ